MRSLRYLNGRTLSPFPAGAEQKDLLSKSDIAILDEVIDRYGSRSADYLSALSHRHKAWLDSQRNRPIDYCLFFADDPGTADVRELVESNQPIRDISRNVGFHTQPSAP